MLLLALDWESDAANSTLQSKYQLLWIIVYGGVLVHGGVLCRMKGVMFENSLRVCVWG